MQRQRLLFAFLAVSLLASLSVTTAFGAIAFPASSAKAKWTLTSAQLTTTGGCSWYHTAVKTENFRVEYNDKATWNSTSQGYFQFYLDNNTDAAYDKVRFLIRDIDAANNVQVYMGDDGEVVASIQAYPNPNSETAPDWVFYLKNHEAWLKYYDANNDTQYTTKITTISQAINVSLADVNLGVAGADADLTAGSLEIALYPEINPATFTELATTAIVVSMVAMLAGGLAYKKSRS